MYFSPPKQTCVMDLASLTDFEAVIYHFRSSKNLPVTVMQLYMQAEQRGIHCSHKGHNSNLKLLPIS